MAKTTQKKKMQLEDLAAMIKGEFDNVYDRFDRLESRMAANEEQIKLLNEKLEHYLQLNDRRYLELKQRDLIMVKWIEKIAAKTGVKIDIKELDKWT